MKRFGHVTTMSRLGKMTAHLSLRNGSTQAADLFHRTAPFCQPYALIAWRKKLTCHGFKTINILRNHSMSTQAGDEKSGHLNTRSGEGIFFLDSA